MSINGEYVRATADELAKAIGDPEWALEFVEGIQNTEEDAGLPPGSALYLTTHKAWQAIGFLLDRAGCPVDVVHGEQQFADEEDWGNGPPRYLTAEQVRTGAQALTATNFDRLTAGVTVGELTQARVYPEVWDEPDSLQWVRRWYEPLVVYFVAASDHGHGMLVWLD